MTNSSVDANTDELNEPHVVAADLLWLLIGMAFIAAPVLLFC
jgi:hypothetical protein